MRKLRCGALAILVALGAVACGGAGDTETAANTEAAANAETAPGNEAAPETRAATPDATATPTDAEETPHVTGQQIADLLDDPEIFLLDVRNPDELPEQGAIEGYTLIPIDELADRLDELPRDKKILTI